MLKAKLASICSMPHAIPTIKSNADTRLTRDESRRSPTHMSVMARIDNIITVRQTHRFYDERLWDLVSRIDGRLLENLTDHELQVRLARIDRNIQHLEEAPGPRDELPPERGWISPWYWFRLRHWVVSEMRERGLTQLASSDVTPMPVVRPEFRGIHAGGEKRLIRISRRDWMVEALEHGRLRFAPASCYCLIEGDEARTDDEMTKAYRRPGRLISITRPDGESIVPIGDVTFSTTRAIGAADIETPYWLTSYSTDLDPRLFDDFSSSEGDDAALVIFDPMEFIRRSLPHLNRVAPHSEKGLHQIEYYDAFYPPSRRLPPLTLKDMRFAYQREWRMILDPGGREVLADGGSLFVDIGSIADISGVYAKNGARIAGTGPETFLGTPDGSDPAGGDRN